jgi:hypothetical protein
MSRLDLLQDVVVLSENRKVSNNWARSEDSATCGTCGAAGPQHRARRIVDLVDIDGRIASD